jgi:tetratricopeptide (TPR) repeat protein
MRLVHAVSILLLILMTSAQCQMTAEDWWDKGNAFYDQSRYDEAIRLDPKDGEAWSNKGNFLISQGKYSEAVKACDEAIRLDSNLV